MKLIKPVGAAQLSAHIQYVHRAHTGLFWEGKKTCEEASHVCLFVTFSSEAIQYVKG